MQKIRTESGLTTFRPNIEETLKIGWCPICDICGYIAPEGYLVPEIKSYICDTCFQSPEILQRKTEIEQQKIKPAKA